MGRRKESDMLEMMADKVEGIAGAHRAPGRIASGTLGPRLIRFHFYPAPMTQFKQVEKLADDFALTLGVPEVRISRENGYIVLEFQRSDPRPVTFSELMNEIGSMPLSSMLLGVSSDGAPLLARLGSPEVAQVLVSGTTGAGKSVLLRTMALSMVLAHRPADLGMVVIDLTARTFPVSWPHLVRPIITDPRDVTETLHSITHLMEVRDRRGEHLPHMVVIIEELADLIMQADNVTDSITRIVQRGRKAGVHIVGVTQKPAAAILSSLMRANFPLRLVGRVVDAADAHMAAGRAGTNAHLLGGRGDFLAVSTDVVRFQVPHVSEEIFAREIATHLPDLRKSAPGMMLETAPASFELSGTISRAETDAEMLLERARNEGRRWNSQNEAERWLCGYNGGTATSRTRAALEAVAQREARSTTTTTRDLVPFYANLGAITA